MHSSLSHRPQFEVRPRLEPILALCDVGDDPRVGQRLGQLLDDVEAERRRSVVDPRTNVQRVVCDDERTPPAQHPRCGGFLPAPSSRDPRWLMPGCFGYGHPVIEADGADPDPARDRPPQRRRARTARPASEPRAGQARLPDDNGRRTGRRGRGLDGAARSQTRRETRLHPGAPTGDLPAAGRNRRLGARPPDPPRAATDPAHAHGEGRNDRADRSPALRLRPASGGRAHLPRPRAPRLLRRGHDGVLPHGRALRSRGRATP